MRWFGNKPWPSIIKSGGRHLGVKGTSLWRSVDDCDWFLVALEFAGSRTSAGSSFGLPFDKLVRLQLIRRVCSPHVQGLAVFLSLLLQRGASARHLVPRPSRGGMESYLLSSLQGAVWDPSGQVCPECVLSAEGVVRYMHTLAEHVSLLS